MRWPWGWGRRPGSAESAGDRPGDSDTRLGETWSGGGTDVLEPGGTGSLVGIASGPAEPERHQSVRRATGRRSGRD